MTDASAAAHRQTPRTAEPCGATVWQEAPLPLLVLTGFLGSGKTTFLSHLLAQPAMRDTAVLINEFGQIGLDHLLVERLAEDVVLLESGCVCCSIADELETALESLFARAQSGDLPPFRRLVLETTGLADPAPLLQRLLSADQLVSRLRIHSVVTVVDAISGPETMEQYAESAAQVAMADRMLISKVDLATDTEVERCISLLRALNPTACITRLAREELPVDELFDARAPADRLVPSLGVNCAPAVIMPSGAGRHSTRLSTFSLSWTEPIPWEDFSAWLEGLLIARGASVLRLKGLLSAVGHERPLVVQGVQHSLYPPGELTAWPKGQPGTQLTFITRDFSRSAVLRSLRQVLGDACPSVESSL